MSKRICICVHCGKEFSPNPRVKNQRFCPDKRCQRTRRASWQRQKMVQDADYPENQRRCQKQWQERNPAYQRLYRKKHPEYVERNKLLQGMRDIRRRKDKYRDKQVKMLVKMDSLMRPYYSRRGGLFKLIPQGNVMLVKMDSIIVKLVAVDRIE